MAALGPAWTMTPPGARREELLMVRSAGTYWNYSNTRSAVDNDWLNEVTPMFPTAIPSAILNSVILSSRKPSPRP